MEKTSGLRFSIDTGGTFTDIVVLDEDTGTLKMDKVPTTPENTLLGVLNAIEKVKLDLANVKTFFVHGSTTAINTLLQRKGVLTAYVTTTGFRDVPEIARYNRVEMYNPKYHKPPQILPRELRFEVTERLNARGEVEVELDTDDVRQVARKLKQKQVKAVAVCLLHAYKNPVHERKVKELLLEEYPEVSVAISSEVVNEHREYERSMTTILNAYLAPVVETWIGDLEKELSRRGFAGQVILTRSDGGGMTGEVAKGSPINTLLSGPAGGAVGGLFIANNFGYPNLITMDVGGTSFDVCMIKDGHARTEQETNISGYSILIPNLDIRSIGAGGGSIAWIDVAGALHVGPQSAGASPGPICYGQGGTEPTVTDAAVANNYIDPNYFLGGEMKLNVELAKEGIKTKVCAPLNMDLYTGSSGMLRIVLSNMVEAIKDIAAQKGDDPREFSLLCFGGGGAIFGPFLMDELDIPRAIIPIGPANFSAWGMLMVDIRHDFVSTLMRKLDAVPIDELNNRFDALLKKGMDVLGTEGIAKERRKVFKSLDMRYAGQEHTVSVPLSFALNQGGKERLYQEFNRVYNDVYGYTLKQPAEIVNLRIMAIGEIPKPTIKEIKTGTKKADAALKAERKVFSFIQKEWIDFKVYERSRLLANNVVMGPALIEEPTTVTVVEVGHQCEVDRIGNLVITRK